MFKLLSFMPDVKAVRYFVTWGESLFHKGIPKMSTVHRPLSITILVKAIHQIHL